MQKTSLIRFVAGAMASALLPACVNLSRTIEPQPIFPPPSQAVDLTGLPTDASGNVCAKTPVLQNRTQIPNELVQFAVTMTCAYNSADGNDATFWLNRFIDKGLSLSDQTCEAFFKDLEARRVEASYSQTNFNLVGTAVAAVLAATDHHRRSIFNVATALTAGNAWFENYKSNYVLTPQLRKLHNKIQTELRDPIKSQIVAKRKSNGYLSFDDAKQDLMKYDALCSHMVIMDVVSDSVAKAEIQTFAPTNPEIPRLIADLHQAATGGGPGTFAAGDVEALYVVAMTPASDRAAAAAALVALNPQMKAYVDTLGFATGAVSGDVLAGFRYLGTLLNFEKDPAVLKIRAQIADQMARAQAAAATTPPPSADVPSAAPPAPAAAPPSAQRAFADVQRSTGRRDVPDVNFRWGIVDNSRR